MTRYGWYSEKQSLLMSRQSYYIENHKPIKYHVYETDKGKQVEVTEITSKYNPNPNFDDVEYKGVLVKWIKNIYVN